MAQQNLIHKGYQGSILIRSSDYSLYGRILFIEEEIVYSGNSFAELEINFRLAVEEYIKNSSRRGEQPPFLN